MALVNAIPEVWSARILSGFDRENIWEGLVTDVSSELASDGDKINLVGVSSTPTVKDYVVDTDIAAPELITDTKTVLEVDQQKYFNIYVDDVDAAQSKPALLDHYSGKAGKAVAKTADDFLYATVFGDVLAAAQKTTTSENIVPAADITDAKLQVWVSEINVVIEKLQSAGWNMAEVYMVGNTHFAWAMREFLARKGTVGAGVDTNKAFRDADIGRLFGVTFRTSAAIANDVSAVNKVVVAFGLKRAAYFARQIRRVEPYRPQLRFGDAVKGLFVYGAKLMDVAYRHAIVTKA